MKELPKRKPNRLKDYDYSQNGAYFVTICTQNRENLFGAVIVGATCGRPSLNELGKCVDETMNNAHNNGNNDIKIDKLCNYAKSCSFDCRYLFGNGRTEGFAKQSIKHRRLQVAPTFGSTNA